MITPEQCKAARALVMMSAAELARQAKVGIATIKRFESGQPVAWATLGAVYSALTAAGVTFISPGDVSLEGNEGVRLSPIPPEG